ncbi:MAG: hypothetical protein M0R47_16845 [Methylobacter sp.]|uniref:hypothetical protein n=1 Tax=Methylobacter sp. TaxID=2051955 RepID=UPI0025F7750C|nr:hypothetical protein [Methylobacter sp.]MCK9622191.1 hypothetical protein [Methylobacter sp.]
MKLKIPSGHAGNVEIKGQLFTPDKNGQIDVPDKLISTAIWQKGFTVAPPEAQPEQITKPAEKPFMKKEAE